MKVEGCPPPPNQPAQLGTVARVLNVPLIGAIYLYRVTLSPMIGGQCRFMPTCSEYALQALRVHGPWRGTGLTIRRLLRCHPWSKGGYDAPPPARRS